MINLLLTVILIMLWLVSCAVSAVGGIFIYKRFFIKSKHPPRAMAEKDRRIIEKTQHEYNNFLQYSGDEMPKFDS